MEKKIRVVLDISVNTELTSADDILENITIGLESESADVVEINDFEMNNFNIIDIE